MVKDRLKRGKTKDKRYLNATDATTPDAVGTDGNARRIKVAHSRVRIYYIKEVPDDKKTSSDGFRGKRRKLFFCAFFIVGVTLGVTLGVTKRGHKIREYPPLSSIFLIVTAAFCTLNTPQ